MLTRRARLPERMEGDAIELRRWEIGDAEAMHRAVAESAEHLRPWVAWVDQEPDSIDGRRAFIVESEQVWRDGGGVRLGIYVGMDVADGCSLLPGIRPGVLEIGYWLHPFHLGRGLATRAARLLTASALAHPGTAAVEICHDRANPASAGIPRRLAYRFVGERANPLPAPADDGVDHVWRMERGSQVPTRTHR